MTARDAVGLLERERLLAIVRTADPRVAHETFTGLVTAGVKMAELSLSPPNGMETFTRCVAEFGDELTLGAGTVRTVAEAERALAAGAKFLVAPDLALDVVAFAQERDVLHLPGVLTPTEVGQALDAGAPLLKLFPAARMGPEYVDDLLGPYPGARLIPTGGIDAANAPDYLAAGAVAVAFAGSLAAPDAEGVAAKAAEALLMLTRTPKDIHAR